VLQHVSDHRGSIITEPCTELVHKNDSIVSVDMDKVGVMAAYSDPLCVCVVLCIGWHSELHTHTQWVKIYCHTTDLVHVKGHDRIILVIFSQALYKAP